MNRELHLSRTSALGLIALICLLACMQCRIALAQEESQNEYPQWNGLDPCTNADGRAYRDILSGEPNTPSTQTPLAPSLNPNRPRSPRVETHPPLDPNDCSCIEISGDVIGDEHVPKRCTAPQAAYCQLRDGKRYDDALPTVTMIRTYCKLQNGTCDLREEEEKIGMTCQKAEEGCKGQFLSIGSSYEHSGCRECYSIDFTNRMPRLGCTSTGSRSVTGPSAGDIEKALAGVSIDEFCEKVAGKPGENGKLVKGCKIDNRQCTDYCTAYETQWSWTEHDCVPLRELGRGECYDQVIENGAGNDNLIYNEVENLLSQIESVPPQETTDVESKKDFD